MTTSSSTGEQVERRRLRAVLFLPARAPAMSMSGWRRALPLLGPILLPLIFFARYLANGHVVPFGDDILLLNYPLMTLVAHALHGGYPLLWNPYSGGGYPLAPFSALPFYLPIWLLALLPVPAAMSWTYALDLVIGGLGAYALAVRIGVSTWARIVPAVVFAFSGFVLAHLYAGHYLEVGLICWLPATLATLHWAAAAPTLLGALRRGIICGGPLGMMILANGVSWLVFVDYPVGMVALVLAVRAARGVRERGRAAMLLAALHPLGALAMAGITTALLGAVVLLPLRELLGATVRGGAMNYAAATRVSEPPLGLVMALAPGLFGADPQHTYWYPSINGNAYYQEVYTYIGLLPLVLAIAGAIVGRYRSDIRLYAALAILGVVLGLGASTPLYAVVYRLVPGLDLARVPARWLLLSVVALAVLAGVGADALAGTARERALLPRRGSNRATDTGNVGRIVPVALAVLAALVLLGLAGIVRSALLPQATHHADTILPALLRFAVVALVTGIVVLVAAQAPRSLAVGLLVLATLADLWSANSVLVRPLDPAPYFAGSAVDLARAKANGGRIWSLDRSIPLRLGMLDRTTRDIQDFAPLTLADYWLFTHPGHTLQGVDTGMARADVSTYTRRLAELLGVSVILSGSPLPRAGLMPLAQLTVVRWGLLRGDWSHPGPRKGTAYAYRVANPLPFALPIYHTRTLRGGVPLEGVLAPGFDAHQLVLLDGSVTSPAMPNGLAMLWRNWLQPAATAQPMPIGPDVALDGASENGSLLRVTMHHAGTLLLDQVYDPGWTATVDGRPVPLKRADYLFTALLLTAGRHTVALVYAPLSYPLGAALTVLGYVVLLGAIVIEVRRRKSAV